MEHDSGLAIDCTREGDRLLAGNSHASWSKLYLGHDEQRLKLQLRAQAIACRTAASFRRDTGFTGPMLASGLICERSGVLLSRRTPPLAIIPSKIE
jgi:hypothetical protein